MVIGNCLVDCELCLGDGGSGRGANCWYDGSVVVELFVSRDSIIGLAGGSRRAKW